MSFFFLILDCLLDAENLLSLEPAELAGPLFASLVHNRIDVINPNTLITYEAMIHEINNGGLKETYPPRSHNDVLRALMEAWQWLEHDGLVTPMPSGTEFFISRRGQKIKGLVDFERYLKTKF